MVRRRGGRGGVCGFRSRAARDVASGLAAATVQ
jgi:hypothetical protein